jgi:type II secretion system protein J
MSRERGFTLLELMVSMALMILIGVLAFASLSFARASLERTQTRVSDVEEIANVQSRLREWIERAYPFEMDRATRLVFYPLSGDDRSLTISTSLGAEARLNRLSRVRIRFDEAGQALVFQHQLERNDLDQPSLDSPQHPLLSGVSTVRFDYLELGTPARWVSNWTRREAFPLAIRLKIDFIDGDSRVFPDLVASPHLDAPAWCEFDPVSRGCRNLRAGT